MEKRKILQAKPKFPKYVKKQCLAIVQGYDDRQSWYMGERDNILNGTPSGYTTYIKNGEQYRQYNPHVSGKITDIPYDKTVQLDQLEQHIKVKQNRAVDDAKLQIGLDLPESSRQKLIKAIMINCEEPRRYAYEYLDVGEISKSAFYRRRDRFLYNIAYCLQIV